MKYIECPAYYKEASGVVVYLAGGITHCPNWQAEVVTSLANTDLTVLNPRRKLFQLEDPSASSEQIKWEYLHMRVADVIAFWFPEDSVCPIALFELGAWTMTNKQLVVGVAPGYVRRLDVEIQLGLARPELTIKYAIAELVQGIIDTCKRNS